MGYFLKTNSTARELLFFMVDSADHLSGKTGLAPTVTIRKPGGAFGTPTGAVTEIANGWYKVAGNATDTNTLGPLLLHATAANADPTDDSFNVVAFDPDDAVHLGLSCLPNAAAGASGGLMRLGANVGNTTFTGASFSSPALSFDGLQLTNANWGAYPLYFVDSLGTGTVGLSAVGSASVFTFTAAGGHIFNMTPGANKDVFHTTLSGTGSFSNVPIPTTEAVPGYVAINQDTGGTDAMTIKSGGNPVVGATIRVFRKSDYTANPTTATPLGGTTSDVNGHWLEPIFVSAGNTYAVVVSAIGEQTQEVDVTV